MTDDLDLDDALGDSNAGAYRKRETREGPPLEYVSEKMGRALEDIRQALNLISPSALDPSLRKRTLVSAKSAFQNGLVAFLALQNMLRSANDPTLMERLLKFSDEDFEEWLETVRSEGSVTG